MDANGQPVASDYVNLRNNHHVAIYRSPDGKCQEKVVSFYEALDRINQGLPVVDKTYQKDEGWEFLFSMKINEMFVFPNTATGFDPHEIDLTDQKNYSLISPNLFRVQKLQRQKKKHQPQKEETLSDEEYKALQELEKE